MLHIHALLAALLRFCEINHFRDFTTFYGTHGKHMRVCTRPTHANEHRLDATKPKGTLRGSTVLTLRALRTLRWAPKVSGCRQPANKQGDILTAWWPALHKTCCCRCTPVMLEPPMRQDMLLPPVTQSSSSSAFLRNSAAFSVGGTSQGAASSMGGAPVSKHGSPSSPRTHNGARLARTPAERAVDLWLKLVGMGEEWRATRRCAQALLPVVLIGSCQLCLPVALTWELGQAPVSSQK
jgi:hypothetical protein